MLTGTQAIVLHILWDWTNKMQMHKLMTHGHKLMTHIESFMSFGIIFAAE